MADEAQKMPKRQGSEQQTEQPQRERLTEPAQKSGADEGGEGAGQGTSGTDPAKAKPNPL